MFIDYSLVGQALDSGNSSITRYYNQVGTLVYNANPLSQTDANGNVSGSVTLQDVSSSSHDYHANGNVYYSGAVEFNGSNGKWYCEYYSRQQCYSNKQCSNEIHCA